MALETSSRYTLSNIGQNMKPYEPMWLVSSPRIVDSIITVKGMDIFQKKGIIFQILEYGPHTGIDIGEHTMSKLLCIKEENIDFLELYINIVRYASDRKLNIFSYQHLYHLILQPWMDIPLVISNEFKKHLIVVALNGSLPTNFIDQINIDSSDWFDNLENNKNLADIVDWLCHLDRTGRLFRNKNDYLESMKIEMAETKLFQKVHNITKEEYHAQQQKSKRNGLCKFIREGKKCENGPKCKFYHGKIEETYGVQMCRNGINCTHFYNGDCKFVHEPTPKQIVSIKEFYGSLKKYQNGFFVHQENLPKIERNIKSNPYILLKLENKLSDGYYYTIPHCQCPADDQDTGRKCDKPVNFVVNKKNQNPSYYCCYEHMVKCQPNSPFLVKQNILNKVLDKHI